MLPAFGPIFPNLSTCLLNVVIVTGSTTPSCSSFHIPTTLRFLFNITPLTLNLCPLVLNSPTLGKKTLHSAYLFPHDFVHDFLSRKKTLGCRGTIKMQILSSCLLSCRNVVKQISTKNWKNPALLSLTHLKREIKSNWPLKKAYLNLSNIFTLIKILNAISNPLLSKKIL